MAITLVQLRIEEAVWRKTRAFAMLEGVSASALVQRLLEELVGMEGSDAAAAQDGPEALEQDQDRGLLPGGVGDGTGGPGDGELAG
jgi:hypothetical protein